MPAWTAQSVLDLSRAFMQPRVLLTGAELDLYTLLSHEALTAEEVADRVQGDLRALTITLDALAAMELLTKQDGKYRCEPPVSDFLAADAPQSVLPMVLHAAVIAQRWWKLTELCGPDGTASKVGDSQGQLAAFIGAMHVINRNHAHELVEAAPPGDARKLIDIGGASGTFTMAYLKASPELTATLFDRPPVVEMARERLAEEGYLDRVTLAPGDFYADELPTGHDLALLSAIIHQNSPEQNIALYRKVARALVPGGRLIIRDHVLSPDRTRPLPGALFAVNMLCATPGGNSYTFDDIRSTLEAAGFGDVTLRHEDQRMNGVVEARKP